MRSLQGSFGEEAKQLNRLPLQQSFLISIALMRGKKTKSSETGTNEATRKIWSCSRFTGTLEGGILPRLFS